MKRRDFVRAGAVASSAFFVNTRLRAGSLYAPPSSPSTTPWLQPLAFPQWAVGSAQTPVLVPIDPSRHQR